LVLLIATVLFVSCASAQEPGEEFVDFEQIPGPTTFDGIKPPLTVGSVTFSGGQVLDAATFLPANRTNVYGTAHFCPGCLPTITIDFSKPASEISFQLINGWTRVVSYTVEDDQGGMAQATLPANFDGGETTISLPSSDVMQVEIRGDSSSKFGFFIDSVSFTVEAEEFKISFSAFIPGDHVTGPPTEKCFSFDLPPVRQLFFKGDNRNFSATAASFRTRQLVTVIANEAEDADGLKEGTIQNLVGESRSYASDALDDGKIDANDEDDIKDDCTLFHDSATAGPDSMVVQIDRVNADTVQVDLDGGPGMPLSTAAQVFGTLDWDFTITIDTSSGMPEWTLTGEHDGFPAYELYINDTEIYRYSPGPAPYSFFTQVRKLLGPLDVEVGNLSGTLP
jgi:hypothetical protein